MGTGRGRAKGKKKYGKERLDRYYHLAKEQGYRARSAFKLIQLAQRFSLFQRPRVSRDAATPSDSAIVDLCAAPGGWLQVCVKHAPLATRILGIDLVPIKRIRGVETLTEDITKPSLPAKIKKLLQGADVWLVLHDGSPNMGTDWSIDAFNQNVLVLNALRTAAQLLCKGGAFVSKVFRSQDYAALLFVLQTLFTQVNATKPQASRNVSAEIFVVCQGYKKPAIVDSRLFDPKSVFLTEGVEAAGDAAEGSLQDGVKAAAARRSHARKEGDPPQQQQQQGNGELVGEGEGPTAGKATTDGAPAAASQFMFSLDSSGSIFGKGKKGLFAELVRQQARRHRHGEQVEGLRKVTVQEFFYSEEPATLLVMQARAVVFQTPSSPLEEAVEAHPDTTAEVLRFLADVQVLGKGELAALLKWRFRVKKALVLQQRESQAALLQQQGKDQVKKNYQEKRSETGEPAKSTGTLRYDSIRKEASTEAGSRLEDDSSRNKDYDEELRRFRASLQRREEKRRKRVEMKERQRELSLRLSRGSCVDAGEGLGHHIDPDLFSFSSKTAVLLEEASAYASAEEDSQRGSDDEKWRQRCSNERLGWIEDDDRRKERGGSASEREGITREEDAGEASGDELDAIDYMEAELTLGHRLQKMQKTLAGATSRKVEKKKTRREKVRSEWAAELKNFRNSMQAKAAAVWAQKARQEVEIDESEEEEDKDERRTEMPRNGEISKKTPVGAAVFVDEEDNDATGTVGSSIADSDGLTKSKRTIGKKGQVTCGIAEKQSLRQMQGKAKEGMAEGGLMESERTARWFQQPLFEGCEADVLLAVCEREDMGEEEDEEEAIADELNSGSYPKRAGEAGRHSHAKKRRRRQETKGVADADPSKEYIASDGGSKPLGKDVGGGDGAGADEEAVGAGEEGGEEVTVELDESMLPHIPVCEKKRQQQRRREQTRKEQEKASKRTRKNVFDNDANNDDDLQESTPRGANSSATGQRLEEVPAFDVGGSRAIKPPSDPEELAQIQAMGSLMVKRSTRMDLIDGAYNRYAFNDEQLPEWFEEEETKYNKPELPVTKELMQQYREKLSSISRRPIRKVQEARARKKLRERRRLQKVKSQAAAIADSAEFTEAGKARAIQNLARKAGRVKEKANKDYLVICRGVRAGRKLVSKNKNAASKRGRAKLVDRRMKKDKRAQKRNVIRKSGKGLKKSAKKVRRKNGGTMGRGGGPGRIRV